MNYTKVTVLEIYGIRFELQQIGSTDWWMLIAGGVSASEVAQRVSSPPDQRKLAWVYILVTEEDQRALTISGQFPNPSEAREFVWCYEGHCIPRYNTVVVHKLTGGSFDELEFEGKPHDPDQFL